MPCGGCGFKYSQGSTFSGTGKGTSRGVIKKENLEVSKQLSEEKPILTENKKPLIPVAGTSGPAKKQE